MNYPIKATDESVLKNCQSILDSVYGQGLSDRIQMKCVTTADWSTEMT